MIDVMVSLFMRCPMMPHPSSALNMGMAREGSCLPRPLVQQAPVVPDDGKPRALLPECLG